LRQLFCLRRVCVWGILKRDRGGAPPLLSVRFEMRSLPSESQVLCSRLLPSNYSVQGMLNYQNPSWAGLRVEALMVLLVAAVIVGGLLTFAVLLQFGALTAFAIAPFGGSFSALLAGLLLAFWRADRKQKRPVKALSRGRRQRLKPAPSRAAPAWGSTHGPLPS
jgi:hypothetical protein